MRVYVIHHTRHPTMHRLQTLHESATLGQSSAIYEDFDSCLFLGMFSLNLWRTPTHVDRSSRRHWLHRHVTIVGLS